MSETICLFALCVVAISCGFAAASFLSLARRFDQTLVAVAQISGFIYNINKAIDVIKTDISNLETAPTVKPGVYLAPVPGSDAAGSLDNLLKNRENPVA